MLGEDKRILRSTLSSFTLVKQPQEFHREWSQRRQFLKRAFTGPLKKTVPHDGTILAYNFLRMSTSHFVWRQVSWIPLTPLRVKLGWSNFIVMETFSADSDDLYVCELVGLPVGFRSRFDLCVVNTSNVARFLVDVPSKLLRRQ